MSDTVVVLLCRQPCVVISKDISWNTSLWAPLIENANATLEDLTLPILLRYED
jgi:hypothetical protein